MKSTIQNGEKTSLISRSSLSQICAVLVKNLVLIGYGMSMVFPTILIPNLSERDPEDPLHIDKDEMSWMGSIALITIPFGCLVSGIVTQPLGRRRSMQLTNVPYCLSWICYYFASEKWHIFTILIFIGINGGLMEAPVLTYVAEVSEPHLRGMLASSALVAGATGIMIQFILGKFLDWRSVALCSGIVPMVSFCLLFVIPETPLWLLSKDRYEEAKKSLAWLRGWVTFEDVAEEYEEILCSMHKNNDPKVGKYGDEANELVEVKKLSILDTSKLLFKKNSFRPLLLVSFICFLSHFCGISPIIVYAVGIFDAFHSPIEGRSATAVLGVGGLIASTICVFMVGKTGRRLLCFISLTGTAISFAILGIYSYLFHITLFAELENSVPEVFNATQQVEISVTNSTTYSWIPCFTIIFALFASLIGIKILPWSLVGEIFPNETRAVGSGVMGMNFYLLGFLCNKTFFTLISILTLSGTFFLYSSISCMGAIILYFVLPETEGRTLQEINDHFSGKLKLGNKFTKGKEYKSVRDVEAAEK